MDSTHELHSQREANWSQLPARRQKLRDRKATRQYVEELEGGAHGQLCVLYLNGALDLIAAMRWCSESPPALGSETGNILRRGKAIGAAGFILARRELSEKYHPDRPTVVAVSKLRHLSAEFGLPLLDYLVFPLGPTVSVGGPNDRDC